MPPGQQGLDIEDPQGVLQQLPLRQAVKTPHQGIVEVQIKGGKGSAPLTGEKGAQGVGKEAVHLLGRLHLAEKAGILVYCVEAGQPGGQEAPQLPPAVQGGQHPVCRPEKGKALLLFRPRWLLQHQLHPLIPQGRKGQGAEAGQFCHQLLVVNVPGADEQPPLGQEHRLQLLEPGDRGDPAPLPGPLQRPSGEGPLGGFKG